MTERRWCGPEFPAWSADSVGRVYRDGVEVTPWCGEKYLFVSAGGGVMLAVHRLVATAFHGPCPPGAPLVCHRNDVGTDNRSSNLYWGTYQDNALDRQHNAPWKLGIEADWSGVSAAIVRLREHAEASPENLRELESVVARMRW